MRTTATRHHDFSMGHTVTGHKYINPITGKETEDVGPCSHIHGHNYRCYFTVEADELDTLGRVLDFTCIKAILCEWLEHNWDHRFVMFKDDYRTTQMISIDPTTVLLDFNPTAENLASYLLNVIAPKILPKGVILCKVTLEETRKCSATVMLD